MLYPEPRFLVFQLYSAIKKNSQFNTSAVDQEAHQSYISGMNYICSPILVPRA
jgi:hypothetical protein